MATLGATVLTKLDWDKRVDPDGKIPMLAELLAQQNPILNHIVWKASNQPTSHLSIVRTSRPGSTWRRLNEGVAPTKSTTRQITDGIGMLEAWSEVDADLAELNGNSNEFRLSEATAHLEGMNQEFAATYFYGNAAVAQEEFTGIAARFNDPAGDTGENIIDVGGASTGCTSIFLIGHGAETVFGVYPKGSQGGLKHENIGLTTITGTAGMGGTRLRGYQDHFQWKCGLVVKDWRYVVRAASIKISTLIADPSGGTINLINTMVKMLHKVPNLDNSGVKFKFYVTRTVAAMLDVQALNKANLYLTVGEEEGKRKLMLRGIEICGTDAVSDNETAI